MSHPAPRTILFVHSGRDWIRGSERCLLDLVEGLDRDRFTPVVACDAPTLRREAERAGASVEHVALGESVVPSRAARRAARELLRRTGARLVHANVSTVVPALLPAARARRVPIVAHLHITPNLADRRHAWLHQVAAAVGVARHVVDGLHADGMAPERIRVIYNGIDRDRLHAPGDPPSRESLGIGERAFVVASVGSLIERKGHDVSIHALSALRARGVDAHLVICGDGEAGTALRALAASAGVAAQTHFLGTRGDVGAVLRALADVYAAPAHDEAMPLNVLEAQLLGCAVVASDIPAHHEAIAPGGTGVLFRDGDPSALASALARLADDPGQRQRFGEAGRARVEQGFLIEHYRRAFDDLYESLLTSPDSRYGWVGGTAWPRTYTDWVGSIAARALRRGRPRAGGADGTPASGGAGGPARPAVDS
jgi:glycosyltransferase involved in cell wall biosynthesis